MANDVYVAGPAQSASFDNGAFCYSASPVWMTRYPLGDSSVPGPVWSSAWSHGPLPASVVAYGPVWKARFDNGPAPLRTAGPVWKAQFASAATIVSAVRAVGPVWRNPYSFAYSASPEWSSLLESFSPAVSGQIPETNAYVEGPAWSLFYGLAASSSPRWSSAIAQGVPYSASQIQALWSNLMAEDGAETARFTGQMAAFRQLARIGRTIYAFLPGGDVYPVGGATDNGSAILHAVTTVNSQYGSPWAKRCQFVYFGTPNDVSVSPGVDGKFYAPGRTTRGNTGERMAKLQGGPIGVNWAFKIESTGGSRLRLNHFLPRLDMLDIGLGT